MSDPIVRLDKQLPVSAPGTPPRRNHGGYRPGAGRPAGARNKASAELKALLKPLDAKGVERLTEIVERGTYREVIEALRLAWEYRHGKPKQVERVVTEAVGTDEDRGVIRVGGDQQSYIAALRQLRAE